MNLGDEAAREIVKDVFKMVGKELKEVKQTSNDGSDQEFSVGANRMRGELISKSYSLKKPSQMSPPEPVLGNKSTRKPSKEQIIESALGTNAKLVKIMGQMR